MVLILFFPLQISPVLIIADEPDVSIITSKEVYSLRPLKFHWMFG